MPQARATVSDPRWDESTYSEHDGGKLARADVSTVYRGTLEGEGVLTYLMSYLADGTGTFVGYERVAGSLDGRSGTFVLLHDGTFDETAVRATVTVVAGTGSGELAGLSGTGSMHAAYTEETHPIELQWTLEEEA